jgi:hypothetical protein
MKKAEDEKGIGEMKDNRALYFVFKYMQHWVASKVFVA